MTAGAPRDPAGSWVGHPWDGFDPLWYANCNYGELREDDELILRTLRDVLVDAEMPQPAAGLDVGPGPNLYPSLAMLPFCDTITLWEYAAPNVRWLKREVPSYSPLWDPFWAVLSPHPRYGAIADPRRALAERVKVCQGSVFDLPEQRWDVGSMMFVAESISTSWDDFRAAVSGFVRALRPGAPLAIAFMENSRGYRAGQHRYPAVPVTVDHIHDVLEPITDQLHLHRIGKPRRPFRAGYDGMILATARAAAH